MSSKFVRDTVDAFINDSVDVIDAKVVDLENVAPDLPTTLERWVGIQYLSSEENQISTGSPGNNVWREQGNISIHCAVASGLSTSVIRVVADNVQKLLRGAHIDGIVVPSVNPPVTREDVRAMQGNWYVLSVVFEYYYDIHA